MFWRRLILFLVPNLYLRYRRRRHHHHHRLLRSRTRLLPRRAGLARKVPGQQVPLLPLRHCPRRFHPATLRRIPFPFLLLRPYRMACFVKIMIPICVHSVMKDSRWV